MSMDSNVRWGSTKYSQRNCTELDNIVRAHHICHDCSFVTVLRALLLPRGVEGYCYSSYDESYYRDNPWSALADVRSETDQENKHYVFIMGSVNIQNALANKPESFTENERVHKYCESHGRDFADVHCFVDEEAETTVLLWNVNSLTWKGIHWLASTILATIPYYFKEKELTADETDLMSVLSKAQRESNFEDFRDVIDRMYNKTDIAQQIMRRALTDIAAQRFETTIREKERKIEEINDRIKDLMESLSCLDRDKACVCAEHCGLLQAKANNEKGESLIDFVEALKDHVRIESIEQEDGYRRVTVWCKDYLDNFDEDMADRYIKNDNSFFYEDAPAPRAISKNGMRKLLKAIFVERELKIRMCAGYTFTTQGDYGSISGVREPEWCEGSVQNPHIYYHACLGDYRSMMRDAVVAGDYEQLINCFLASVKSLNIAEAPTAGRFVNAMYKEIATKKFIELPDGTVVSPVEAVEFLGGTNEEEGNE